MKPGILKSVPMQDYILDRLGDQPTLSASLAHLLLAQSPLHAKWAHPKLSPAYEQDNAERADIGSVAHELLVGGESRIVEVMFDDYRKNEAKAARDAAYAEGKIPVLSAKLAAVHAMVKVAREFIPESEIAGPLEGADAEVTVVWQEMFLAEGGSMKSRRQDNVWCRARPDWLSADRRWHISYKTTQGSAEPSAWIRNHLSPDGHDVAALFYEQGIGHVGGNKDVETIFLVQEQNAPYACSLVGLDPAMRDLASRKVNRAINLWAQAMASGEWPCYPAQVHYAEPMPWDEARFEERGYMFTNKELEGGIPL